MDAFISMITPFGCNFVIRNWGACAGGIIAISQNASLYSLIGTFYGGDGRSTFGLPDLRGRAPVNFGAGPGLDPVILGQKSGLEYTSIGTANLPSHDHAFTATGATNGAVTSLPVSADAAFSTDPDGNYLGTTTSSNRIYATTLSTPAGEMGPIDIPSQTFSVSGTTFNTGLGQQFYVRSPYQGVNFQICMFGLYPSRS
jgi:microcystin-dependent protein